ncbi:MAG: hypothetical protein FJ279_25580 [Planctomycetes bacterium]|nr:hypothetical protein [Planctomycetota bacterium]
MSVSLVIEGGPSHTARTHQFYAGSASPTVVTETVAGPLTLAACAYRAPIWPEGVDVLEAIVRNNSADPRTARLVLRAPKELTFQGTSLRHGGRAVVALPPAQPILKNSGCLTDARALPRWGKPAAPCDPGFQHIRAGMGGIPITYRFAVDRGAGAKVALGFCESHWADAKRRIMLVQAEGAAQKTLDPIAEWGKDMPGGLLFEAKDANHDGWLEVSVSPKPGSPDVNPILNVIWVFAADAQLDVKDVVLGRLNRKAKHYVDVGGSADEPQSEPGKIEFKPGEATYAVSLPSGKDASFTFLVATGSAPAPAWESTDWTAEKLRAAAEAVWSDWFKTGTPVSLPDAAAARQCRAALAQIMMSRGQADGYFLALPRPGAVGQFSHAAAARIVRALDLAGHTREAERMLRVLWQRPAPKPFAAFEQSEDGQWKDGAGSGCPQAQALLALAQHAVLTGDRDWASRAYPAMAAGAAWVRKSRADGKALSSQDAAWLAHALRTAAAVARMLGHADDAAWMLAEAQSLSTIDPDETAAYASLGPCVEAANCVIGLCTRAK